MGCADDSCRPREDDEKLIGFEVPYRSVTEAIIYLINYTQRDMLISITLLSTYSFLPIRRHLKGVNHILDYLKDKWT